MKATKNIDFDPYLEKMDFESVVFKLEKFLLFKKISCEKSFLENPNRHTGLDRNAS